MYIFYIFHMCCKCRITHLFSDFAKVLPTAVACAGQVGVPPSAEESIATLVNIAQLDRPASRRLGAVIFQQLVMAS